MPQSERSKMECDRFGDYDSLDRCWDCKDWEACKLAAKKGAG